ncbi:MAG TPA: hypothetical protein VF665_17260 [Longimicrobium sp.]|jgi:hypothetical protein|uniref:hypothetical protein n=1 Tax=Longimicrobium sp. TaxID=2029185 RepID=UPI002EDACD61
MKRVVALTAPLLGALLACAPCAAQRSTTSESRMVEQHDGYRMEVRMRGPVEVNEAGDWVESIGPGGRLIVEESGRGPDRRAEFTRGADGGVQVAYVVDGRTRAMDAAGREWARGMVLRAVREGGLGAERRVARLRSRGGVPAVLREIGMIRGDSGKRLYFNALLGGSPLSDGEMRSTLAAVGRELRSDTERRLVLTHAIEHGASGRNMAALLEAAGGMESDTETRLVLTSALSGNRLDASSRAAFFRVVDGIGSDVERRLVLTSMIRRGMDDGAVSGVAAAVGRMRSDTERRLVLSNLLDSGLTPAQTAVALGAVMPMRSDAEKRIVLSQVPSAQFRDSRVNAAYRRVLDSMSSDSERSIALRRLVNGN